uniref:Rab3 GTPase-activating protein catalytic subunit n=1 Tax=Schistocephalus solidus TaxID=70667 RepID=A0A183TMH1_SCHSO
LRESQMLKRFTLGVQNTELYSKFIHKQYTSLKKALEVARGYEAVDVAQRQLPSVQIFSVLELTPSTSATISTQSVTVRSPIPAALIVANLAGKPSAADQMHLFTPSCILQALTFPLSSISRMFLHLLANSSLIPMAAIGAVLSQLAADGEDKALHLSADTKGALQVTDPHFGETYDRQIHWSQKPESEVNRGAYAGTDWSSERTFVDRGSSDRWAEHLPQCLLTYWTAVHESTGFSPASLQLGDELRLPADIHFPLIPAEAISMGENA